MGDLYASAIGTTVLHLKELPVRPEEYDGALGLFDLAEGVDEAKIRAALGGVVSVKLGGWPPAVVRFSTHAVAIDVKRKSAQLTHICGGIDTLYNERPYEERGWCVFESAASSELIVRLQSYPKMNAALKALPPKMLGLSTTEPIKAVELQSGSLATRVEDETARIERTTFTGKGDKPVVIGMYKGYVGRIATALQKTLALAAVDASTPQVALVPPMPADTSFEAVLAWHLEQMRTQHTTIADALSGQRLDVRTQCVQIAIAGTDASGNQLGVHDAAGLSVWLPSLRGGAAPRALLTAGPASGKTWLMSQVIARLSDDVVPILVKVEQLQKQLGENEAAFAAADDSARQHRHRG